MSHAKNSRPMKREDRPNARDPRQPAQDVYANLSSEVDTARANHQEPDETAQQATRPKSAEEIFSDVFSVREDKDGRVKLAHISKTDLKTLRTRITDKLDRGFIDKLCSNVALTDPELSCLASIVVDVMDYESSPNQTMLFDACIRIASGAWINKHEGSIDFYDNIFISSTDVKNPIDYLDEQLTEKFKKRIDSAPSKADVTQPMKASLSHDQAHPVSRSTQRATKSSLAKQQRNLLTIGVLWLIQKKRIDINMALEYLIDGFSKSSTPEASLQEVGLYLASQRLAPDARLIRVLSILNHKTESLMRDKTLLETRVEQLLHNNSRIEEKLTLKKQELEQASQELLERDASIEQLKHQIEEQQLEARADYTHLRDNEDKVRFKAFNLMSEDVLEPLRLSLAALLREKPKVEVAAHHIELAVDSIERNLKWFKE